MQCSFTGLMALITRPSTYAFTYWINAFAIETKVGTTWIGQSNPSETAWNCVKQFIRCTINRNCRACLRVTYSILFQIINARVAWITTVLWLRKHATDAGSVVNVIIQLPIWLIIFINQSNLEPWSTWTTCWTAAGPVSPTTVDAWLVHWTWIAETIL